MNKKQLWERKLAQRDKKLKEAYDDYATVKTADGKQVSASASTRSTRTYNYEDVEFEFDARKGFGTYRWMNRPWQKFDFASALQEAMIDAGVDKEFARECIEKSGSLRSAIEFFAKNYETEKKEVDMMNESHDDKELLDAVMDSFGFTKDEALEYIKKASDKTKRELVKGFRQDAKRNFYDESKDDKRFECEDGKMRTQTEHEKWIKHLKKLHEIEEDDLTVDELRALENAGALDESKDNEDDDKVYQIKYWLTEEDREEGFSDIFIDSFDSKQEAIMTAKKMVDRGDVASVEVFDADDVTEQPVYFYDGNEENCPECGKELGKDERCYNSDCDEYEPLSQYFDDEDKTDLDESAQEDRKELDYLWRKEKVTSLDKYEMHRLQELIQMYGRLDENKNNSLKENKQLNEMIVDLILDRKDSEEYSPEKFYRDVMRYNSSFEGIADEITRAMDFGTEEDVKRALCKYIEDNEYSKSICDYINSVKWLNGEKDLKEARGAGKGQKLDKYYRMVVNLYKDNLSKEEIERLKKAKSEVEKFEPKSEYEKRDKKNLLDQIAQTLKDGTLKEAIDLDKHVWEGWTVQDFIDELEPLFDQIMSGRSWKKPFKDKAELRAWCIDNQPYYKRYIPGVVEYFFKKMKKNENLKEALVDYDPAEWEPEDIELHKSIDWKERNYEDFLVEGDTIETEVILYSLHKLPKARMVTAQKYLRANAIYPPYYEAKEVPFKDEDEGGVVGGMFDGNKHNKTMIMDRYETVNLNHYLSI